MKFTITMKDPDGVQESVGQEVRKQMMAITDLDADVREEMREALGDKLYLAASRWLRYGEYVDLEIDTDAGTCVMIPHV